MLALVLEWVWLQEPHLTTLLRVFLVVQCRHQYNLNSKPLVGKVVSEEDNLNQ